MVGKHDIMHKSIAFDPFTDPETSDIMLILLSMFFCCPRHYYNDYKITREKNKTYQYTKGAFKT